jgi:adenylate kinase family enzyme
MMDAIAARLRQPDCVNNGWVLEGFPTNKAQLSALQKYDISPNR